MPQSHDHRSHSDYACTQLEGHGVQGPISRLSCTMTFNHVGNNLTDLSYSTAVLLHSVYRSFKAIIYHQFSDK